MKYQRPLFLLPFALCLLLSHRSHSQSQLLDDFETLSGWRAIPSEGAKLDIRSGEGKTGKAMVMEFDLSEVYGYTIAQKDFPLELPPNYQFTFDLKADIPVNNFEFKLLDADENVFWIKKLNVEYPKTWERQRIKKRHIAYAWGPAGGGEIHNVAKIEFVVSSGLGGKGKVFIDNFRFEPIDDNLAMISRADVDASSMKKTGEPIMNEKGTLLQNWKGSNAQEWLSINFNYLKEIGGLAIDWDTTNYATAYDVQLSDDGKEWETAYTVRNGNGGRDYVYLPERDAKVLRISCNKSASGAGYGITRLEVKGPEFSQSANAFFSALAQEAPKGYYPKFFLNQQCFWTIVGTSGDTREALINELGTVEVDQLRFSLEPFLFIDNKLITWNDVTREQSLLQEYLPIPSVTWKYGGLKLTIRAFAPGTAGNSSLIVTYKIENKGGVNPKGKLFVALRPFQVNPPWQWLNKVGGASRIDSIRNVNGLLYVQDKVVVPISGPSRFGATSFDSGEIMEYLQVGKLPAMQSVRDARGFASAALEYDYDCPSGVSREFHVVIPSHHYAGTPTPNMRDGADIYTTLALEATMQFWVSKLDRFQIKLPASAQPIINTIKSQLAYIFINRDGPGIQPGSRSYERSWIRDGALTSTALLELGITNEVKEYIDWYATYQFPSGKIPCVVDQRGGDPTNEHDSHGEFIYAVMQYFNFTKDTAWLRTKFDRVVKTVRFIQSLRAERKTEIYKTGTPEQRACFGLVPESISHEGYSAKPMHSYWDDFFILRGLKDATTMAVTLREYQLATEFAHERDDFRKDLYASMRLAMKNKNINYIPGCVELGDFDATSTTIGIHPANELGYIPEPQLHNTFDKYYEYFTNRRDGKIAWDAYTPYENRVIGSFVYLDQKERAHAAMEFFMKDRTPAAWNQWGEVVHRDMSTPKFIGDLPHTWCGSDFIRSVRAMFVYERERDAALVVGAGIADAWVNDPAGVEVTSLPTYFGSISYSIKKDGLPAQRVESSTGRQGQKVVVNLAGSVQIPAGKIILKSPLSKKIKSVRLNGRLTKVLKGNEIRVASLPAKIELTY